MAKHPQKIANIHMVIMALIMLIPAVILLVKVMVGKHFKYIRQQLILIIAFSGSLIAYSLCLLIGFNNSYTGLYV
jgi:hypothetical protein